MNAPHPAGLPRDLDQLTHQMSRRRTAMRWMAAGQWAGTPSWGLTGCGSGNLSDDNTSDSALSGITNGSGSTTPKETAGPYPADGSSASSQRLNALTLSGIVRSDIRTSVGVPATLRGVQFSDANGQVSFTTIFPGCYSGRWPHIHFEVYPDLASAVDSRQVADCDTVSQLALPASACTQVYGVKAGYSARMSNLADLSLTSDNVFGNDSAAQQLASVTDNARQGFAASLQVRLSV